MIILITTRGHGYTLRSLVKGQFGCPTPMIRTTHYERLFEARWVRRATYVFGDLERLAPWELQLAADLYRAMTAAGLRCLNDPARAMSRVELLTALHAAGINPFSVYRADSNPRPSRFPVFVRDECNHNRASAKLYSDQAELDRALANLRNAGTPLRGLLVVEQAAERYSDTLWAKWNTWRIGDRLIVQNLALEDTWLVKYGDYLKRTDATIADELDAVTTNRFATELGDTFGLAGIEFGRADHAKFAGRTIIYEINTNPFLSGFELDPVPLGRETQRIGRTQIAEALAAIDTPQRGWVEIAVPRNRRPKHWWPIRWWRPTFLAPTRP